MNGPGGDSSQNCPTSTGFQPVLLLPVRLVSGAFGNTATPARLRVRMRYTVSEPFSVGVEIRTGAPEALQWTVSRDLLDAGTSMPQGMGAHRIWPSRRYLLSCRRLYLGLGGPSTPVTLELDHCEVRAWLDATYDLVPRGSEPELLDWDALERELLQRRD